MDYLLESIRAAIELIFTFDQDIQKIVWTSLYTSFCAISLSAILAVPIGVALGLMQFRGRRIVVTLLNTLMALPTVVVGLVLFGVFSRQGPMGSFGLLFTPVAMIVGQMVLATPIISNYVLAAVEGSDSRIINTALTLGATPLQANIQLIKEIRFGVMAAIIAGFGRVIGEVGVAMMLGGNIRNSTRTMTTAIALETSKGEFAFGLALGIVLLSVALFVNMFLNLLQQR
ncbi:MAG: ABC transporter permease [Desulfuromonadales bacterium C00003068]|nr:ABC transporter permease [Deltaproteobacteria bacterium]OEU75236.1 MAG: ABC transporter permease [Desulfuromonadales bacterium C00003068]